MKGFLVGLLVVAACGDDAAMPDAGGPEPCIDPPASFETGDTDGHAAPLGAGDDQARAGRLAAGDIPAGSDELLTWAAGDFVLANDKVAVVIEDVGESDLYDPWGGRPVAIARVAGGALIEPGRFGEQLLLIGRSAVVTTSVTVMNDGSDGEPAVVRATGKVAPLPFLDGLLSALYFDDLTDLEVAIDYALAPGAEQVEVTMRYASSRPDSIDTGAVLHGFMYTERFPSAVPGEGFTTQLSQSDWVELVDDDGTGMAYRAANDKLGSSLAQSGFVGAFTPAFEIPRCGVLTRPHAVIVLGGPGLDGVEQARRRADGVAQRTITGTVGDGTAMLAGFHVHAVDADGAYLSRVKTDAAGAFSITVPAVADVTLTAYRRGWATGTTAVAASATTGTITVPPSGFVHVQASSGPTALPARIQVLPAGGSVIPPIPEEFGEAPVTAGRLHVEYGTGDDVTLAVPPGDWTVVVSRGFEYELHEQAVTITAGNTVDVDADLARVVDTTGSMCGDFHIHTLRSNDSGDDAVQKVQSAIADGLELPVRTDHEWVNSFQPLIEELGMTAWARGITSVEMTSFQVWGHMNVFPLVEDPTKANRGAPRWQTWPTAESPDEPVVTIGPKAVFEAVRARPEAPTIIINHPRSSGDYFNYVGLDRETGARTLHPEEWDEEFTLIEVFNETHWLAERDRVVADWFMLLNSGRKVFAVGSSDSHAIHGTPVGYPRTCIELGTDTPSAVDGDDVRDQLDAGHALIYGGVYVSASVGAAGHGDTATGTGANASVDLTVQAPTWIDVDSIDVVVDGVTVQTIAVTGAGVTRYDDTITVPVAAGGSWVVIAAYGDAALEPLHPGKVPFGVTQPIFLER